MLYVTTRSNLDVFTAHRALTESRGPDGGQYLPFRSPTFSDGQLQELSGLPFNECVARLLNRMFGSKLGKFDVDFAIGRYPVRLAQLSHRILVGECWHNPQLHFGRTVDGLTRLLRERTDIVPGEWLPIGIRVAILFAVYAALLAEGTVQAGEKVDISLVSGEFDGAISAWYARQWGLPIGSIICCCNENSELWNLIAQGQLRTDSVCSCTVTTDADISLPSCLERLIHGCGGPEEVERYLDRCRRGGMYVPSERVLQKLRDGLYVSVISSHRTLRTIPSVYATHRYLMSPYTALAYSGLLDYRAKTGQLRRSIVIADRSPVRERETVASALGVSPEKLKDYM